jgi:5-methylcytosine-specific restriction protein A
MGGPGSGARRSSRWPNGRGWRNWYMLERWRKISRAQLKAEPLCRICLTRGVVMPATVADHVVEHHGNERMFWHGELQSLCASCHDSDKRIETSRGYLPGTDANGEPTDRRHPWFK